MAKVSNIKTGQNVQPTADILNLAVAAREALQTQLLDQFSGLLAQAVTQIAINQNSAQPKQQEQHSSDSVQTPAEVVKKSVPAVQKIAKESKASQDSEERPADTEKAADSADKVQNKVEEKKEDKKTTEPASKDAAQQTSVQDKTGTDAKQVVVNGQAAALKNNSGEVAVKAVAESSQPAAQAVQQGQAAQTTQVAQPVVEEAAKQPEQKAAAAAQVKNSQVEVKSDSQPASLPVQTAAVDTNVQQPAWQSTKNADLATQMKDTAPQAVPAQAQVAAATAQQAPAVAAPAPENQDLVTRIMQELHDKTVKAEVKVEAPLPQAQASQAAKVAPETPSAAAITVQAQALQTLERNVRTQVSSILTSQAADIAQTLGRDATKSQSIQPASSTSAFVPFRNEQGSTAGRDSEAAKAPKFLGRADTLRTLEKVENAVKEVARSHDGKTISIRLDPPSLGNLKIDVTMKEGSLHARIVAELPQVAAMLREKAHEVHNIIRKIGFDADQVSVSVGQQGGGDETQQEFVSQDWAGSEKAPTGVSAESELLAAGVKGNTVKSPVAVEDHWIA